MSEAMLEGQHQRLTFSAFQFRQAIAQPGFSAPLVFVIFGIAVAAAEQAIQRTIGVIIQIIVIGIHF